MVVMCLWIDDPVTTLSTTWRTARKQHRCGECTRIIEASERYWRSAYTDGYLFGEHKMCSGCRETIALGAKLSGCEEVWYYGALWERDASYGFVADVLNHDLPPGGRVAMLRRVVAKNRLLREQQAERQRLAEMRRDELAQIRRELGES